MPPENSVLPAKEFVLPGTEQTSGSNSESPDQYMLRLPATLLCGRPASAFRTSWGNSPTNTGWIGSVSALF